MDLWIQLINSSFFTFIFSSMLTILLLVWLSKVGVKIGLVDYPGGRKKHKQHVPLVGGLGIFGSISILFLPFAFTNKTYFWYWMASFILVCVCILDDKKTLSSKVRLLVQFGASLLVITIGDMRLSSLGNLWGHTPVLLGLLSIPFTSFSVIGITNAVNMMDGVDGLTAAVSTVEFLVLFLLAVHIGANQEALLILAFLGATSSFLLFNFPSQFTEKRKLFLGDSGSMLLGFTLSCMCIMLTKMPNSYPPILMVWIMALPIMDTLYLILNRKARGVSAFQADRRHIHHILLLLHYTPRQTTLILTSTSCMISAIGIILYFNDTPDDVLFYGFLMLLILYSMLVYGLKKHVIARSISLFTPRHIF